jgi:uncharacterized OsmC-like protein
MTADELRTLQAPLKAQYREHPETAVQTLSATGKVRSETLTCEVATAAGSVAAGLHPATGGDGTWACSADMLLQALVACAGVTLAAVARAMGLALRGATVSAQGDLDFRGTLAVSREAPVGFTRIRLHFDLDMDAHADSVSKLIELTERYCVIFRTLTEPPTLSTSVAAQPRG